MKTLEASYMSIKGLTWDFVFFTICFTKLLLINPCTEPSSELPVLLPSHFPQEEHEKKATNLLTFGLNLFLRYLRHWFVVVLSYIYYLILAINSFGRNSVSLNFTVFIELHIGSSAEQIIIMIATARSVGLTSQNEKSRLPFFLLGS